MKRPSLISLVELNWYTYIQWQFEVTDFVWEQWEVSYLFHLKHAVNKLAETDRLCLYTEIQLILYVFKTCYALKTGSSLLFTVHLF